MINVADGEVKFSGIKPELKADLCVIFHTMYENNVLTKEDIIDCASMATKSEEELEQEVKILIENFTKDTVISNILKEIFDHLRDKGEY